MGMRLLSSAQVQLGGLLGAALDANRRGRLSRFITGPTSPAIAIFDPARVLANRDGDWYGEHAGKWLYAAAKAYARTQDVTLGEQLRSVADHLVTLQGEDGYLGTYAPERRFMQKQPPKPPSWDGAPSARTWDIWTHSYLMLGLLELYRTMPEVRYLDAARKIGDLCWLTLSEGGINITELGNHHGLSATVLLDPAVELYAVTGEPRYLQLAERVLQQADDEPALGLLRKALSGADAAEIATGKAYQLAWNLVGLAKLHKATGVARYREAVDKLWLSIREHHLTLGGGPWGGVAHRSREVFNAPGAFQPQAYVETCSTLAWLQLNRELLAISGEAKYAEEIERSAYNDLLGAMAPNGEDWCYYSFPNGRRVHTTYWRCCKSSGAMAVEELPAAAYGVTAEGAIAVSLYGSGLASVQLDGLGAVALKQCTGYPFDGQIRLRVTPDQTARFKIQLRIPAWAQQVRIQINDEQLSVAAKPGSYAELDRDWTPGDRITMDLAMPPVLHRKANRNVQESLAPDGSPVRQQVLCHEYVAITRGPLVYATGLIDGFKTDETIRLPEGEPADWLRLLPVGEGQEDAAPGIELRFGYREPITFWPYYRAGGRSDGSWRLTWLSLAPVADLSSDPEHGNT